MDPLTEADRRAVAAAKEASDSQAVVTDRPLRDLEWDSLGGLYYHPGPVCALQSRFLPGERLNFGPLVDDLESFLGASAASVFEFLLRTQRAAALGPMPTLDVVEFFDGNGDMASIAANVVGTEDGPSFELIRDTLLEIAGRARVAAVGVEIGELPNPDHPGDDEMWLSAGRVFIWTNEPLKAVREWVSSLLLDGVARGDLKAVAPPEGKTVPPKTKIVEISWD